MKNLFKRIQNRFNAYTRRNEIKDTVSEMDWLQDTLYQALTGRGPLNGPQRMEVLKRLVEQIKEEKHQGLSVLKEQTVGTEIEVDTLKSISFFNLL